VTTNIHEGSWGARPPGSWGPPMASGEVAGAYSPQSPSSAGTPYYSHGAWPQYSYSQTSELSEPRVQDQDLYVAPQLQQPDARYTAPSVLMAEESGSPPLIVVQETGKWHEATHPYESSK
jgi:hypothetical protein